MNNETKLRAIANVRQLASTFWQNQRARGDKPSALWAVCSPSGFCKTYSLTKRHAIKLLAKTWAEDGYHLIRVTP